MSQLFQGLLWEPVFPPTPVLDDDFNAFNITRFEDTFSRTDPAPWVPKAGAGTVLSIVDGWLRVTSDGTGGGSRAAQYTQASVAGNWYKLTGTAHRYDTAGAARIYVSTGVASIAIAVEVTTTDTIETGSVYFQATGTSFVVECDINDVSPDGEFAEYDNILIEEVPALDGWTGGSDAIVTVENSAMCVENGAAAIAFVSKPFSVLSNANYIIELENIGDVFEDGDLKIGTAPDSSSILNFVVPPGVSKFSFNSGANTTLYITLRTNNLTLGTKRCFDNITVQESLVENGTFDSDTTGWTAVDCTIAVVAGELEVTGTSAVLSSWAYQDIPVTIGASYHVQAFYSGGTRVATACSLRVNDTLVGNEGNLVFEEATAADQVLQDTFVPTSTPIRVLMNVTPTIGETALFDNIIVTQDGGAVVGFGGVKFKENSVAAPPLHDRGLPFDDSFILAVDAVNPVDYVYQGLPFTVLGRIAVDLVGPVDRVAPGNIPLSAAGRLVFSAGPVAVAVAGVNYAADESVVGIPS